ncbi:MAG: CaiB/BaiF CoA transferase family protein [Ferrimicrobium acidiphilum]
MSALSGDSGLADSSNCSDLNRQAVSGPLAGLSVLDLSLAMAGPFAAQKLGDLGADVLKIEPTGTGEWHRHVAAGDAWVRSMNCSFLAFNRNKRSLAVDLKQQEGLRIVMELASRSDVVIQNFRPGVADRLGVGYKELSTVNPKLVYCSVSGYGSAGPDSRLPGQDLLLQAHSGGLWNAGSENDPPQVSPFFVADACAAHLAVEGILAALIGRQLTGKGQHVEVSLLGALVDIQSQELSVFCNGGVPQMRGKESSGHIYIKAPYGVFRTKSGWVAISMGPLDTLARGLESLELEELVKLGETADRDSVTRLCREACAMFERDEVVERLRGVGHWAGPVLDYSELVRDPQVVANDYLVTVEHPTEGSLQLAGVPIKFSETPGTIRLPAPLVGQDTVAVLREVGVAEDEIDELLRKGVVQAS